LIKRLLRDRRLLVDCQACPRLAEALEQATWVNTRSPSGERVRGETYSKDGRFEHYLDALGYCLINAFPVVPAAPVAVLGGRPEPFANIAAIQRRYDGFS
jgi:hypothetical protein